MTKNVFFIIFLVFYLSFFVFSFANAVKLPKFGEFYNNLILAAGGLAIIAILIGGIKFLLAVGNPSQIQEAKLWLEAGILGGILIAAAGTIYKGVTGLTQMPWEKEITEIGTETPKPEKSPGVYFCTTSGCPKKSIPGGEIIDPAKCIGPYTSSIAEAFFPKKIKSICIVSGSVEEVYGVIAFNEINWMGTEIFPEDGTVFYALQESENSKGIGFNIGSVAIFNIVTGLIKAGTNITFSTYTNFHGGKVVLENTEIKAATTASFENLSGFKVDYMDSGVPKPIQDMCPNLYTETSKDPSANPWCLTSIKINGNYAVLLRGLSGGVWKKDKWHYQLFMGPDGPASLIAGAKWGDCRPQWVSYFSFKRN